MRTLQPETLQREFGEAVEVRAATQDESVSGILPSFIATPQNEEAASSLVAWCGRENWAFIARGGATKFHLGALPSRCDLLISTEKLNTIHEHDNGNATVEVGSGIMLSSLDEILRAQRQFVPIEYSNTSTLGGAVAADQTGSVALKYGAPRDLVVGLHVALSDGRLVKAGGKVVKNVSGYDLNKLFIGSLGTLGLITRVTIRLRPQDESGAMCRATFSIFDDAAKFAWQIFDGAFEPTALRLSSTRNSHEIVVRFDGVRASVEAQTARLKNIAPDFFCEELNSSSRLFLPEETSSTVEMRARLPLRLASEWIANAQQNGATQTIWDCGLGTVRAAFDHVPDIAALRKEAELRGGHLRLERAPDEVRTPENVWGATGDDFLLIQRLKAKFDPANVCAPGRFVGGL
ncbi:MAG TPA: FAD-binding oxidoreductase [Abditibacteriaceae bacterium]|jgi:glycolate oxidase FAD binding subunit|nr:FAD-binding oxidoreductase [Abditibacteriaceae bacterium]